MITDYFTFTEKELIASDVLSIVIKAVVSIIVLFVLTKLMGNKQISQLSFFDYVVGITIGSIASELAVGETPFLFPIIAMIIYALVSVLVSYISIKSIKARRFLVGTPITLIKNGKILGENLANAKVDVNEFLAEARYAGYFDVSDVEFAVMETNGRFSFLPKSGVKPLTPNDMKIQVEQKAPLANVIVDGVIMENNLASLDKSTDWLKEKLSAKNIELQKVLLATLSEEYEMKIFFKTGEQRDLSPFD